MDHLIKLSSSQNATLFRAQNDTNLSIEELLMLGCDRAISSAVTPFGIGRFIDSHCTRGNNFTVPVTEFKNLLNKDARRKYGQKQIAQYMVSNGFLPVRISIKNRQTRCWQGLKLNEE